MHGFMNEISLKNAIAFRINDCCASVARLIFEINVWERLSNDQRRSSSLRLWLSDHHLWSKDWPWNKNESGRPTYRQTVKPLVCRWSRATLGY